MLKYILKRILLIVPTLFLVTIIGFVLLNNSSFTPSETVINNNDKGYLNETKNISAKSNYWVEHFDLNLPIFYFSIKPLSEPDTLYKISNPFLLTTYKKTLQQTGNNISTSNYFSELNICINLLIKQSIINNHTDSSSVQKFETIINNLKSLQYQPDFEKTNNYINYIKSSLLQLPPTINKALLKVQTSIINLQTHKTIYKNYIPKITWYGCYNQYHRWLFGSTYSRGVLMGDFGISFIKKEPVSIILKGKLIWSLFFSLTSIIIAYLISIPIGVKMALHPTKLSSKLYQFLFFILYSIPPFFFGVLLLMVFSNPDFISILPPSGVMPIGGYSENSSLLEKFAQSLPYIILPLVCYTYSSLAFISRLTYTSVNEQLSNDYIKTAKAKGLSEKQIIWKHAFKNSLLPLVTVLSTVFPGIIGGSIIIESIFSIPGMGLETVNAILTHDSSVVIAILTLSTFLTLISYLLADILCLFIDPRLKIN